VRPVTRRAARAVENRGLRLPVEPDGDMPELPQDITELSDDELMRLLVVYGAWTAFAAAVAAGYESDEKDLETALNRERAAASLRRPELRTVAAQKAAALSDAAVEQLDGEHQFVRASRGFAAVARDNAERSGAVVSRELTRRTARHDRETRTGRWNP